MYGSGKSACKFFVYGTLRSSIKAEYSSIVHNNPNFKISMSPAKLFGVKLYDMTNYGYPTIRVTNNKNDFIYGEIATPDKFDECLQVFDEIEEYPTHYTRKIFSECLDLKENIYYDVWVYIETKIQDLNNSLEIENNSYKHIKENCYVSYKNNFESKHEH